MKHFNLPDFLNHPKSKNKRQRGRTCRIEELENREMLSVSVAEFEVIRNQYTDLELAEYQDYNIIEIAANQLSANALLSALNDAAATEQNDLIVIRTTTTQNNITLNGSELAININAEEWGTVTIVSLGANPLTIDANKQSRILNVDADTNVALAGVSIINGIASTGGAIQNEGVLTITKSAISGNSASSSGGAIKNEGTLTMTHSKIVENSAGKDGGGISSNNGNITLKNNTIAENSAGTGGGINSNSSTLTITNTTIAGNSASTGGGINSYNTNITLTSSVIAGNIAVTGGGINSNGDDTLKLTNNTIAGNEANFAGGVYIDESSNATINNTIIAKNIADSARDVLASGMITGTGNLIGVGAGQTSLTHVDNNIVGISVQPIDPKFVNFDYETWSSDLWKNWDFRLAEGSFAIDSGNNEAAVDDENNILLFDLAGKARTVNDAVDIGAYEHGKLPEKPTALYYVDIATDSISLTWNEVEDAEGYEIRYRKTDNITSWETLALEPGDSIFNLEAGTQYDFQIRATHAEGNSDWSAIFSFRTSLDLPKQFQNTQRTDNSITLEWDAVYNATGYEMEWKVDDQWVSCHTDILVDTVLILDHLTQNTQYEFRIRAVYENLIDDSVSHSDWTEELSVITVLSAPENLISSDKTEDSIMLQWNAVDGAEYYHLEYSLDGIDWNPIEDEIEENTYTHTGVLPNQQNYYYRISAVNESSESEFSEVFVLYQLYEWELVQTQSLENYAVWENIAGTYRLTQIHADGKELTGRLDLTNCTELVTVIISNNHLTELDLSDSISLATLDFSNNKLTFPNLQLPIHEIANLISSNQKMLPITATQAPHVVVDMSAGYLESTTYTWYINGLIVADNNASYSNDNGVFAFTGLVGGDVIYCIMANDYVPGMMLQTSIETIIATQLKPPTLNSVNAVNKDKIEVTWTPVDHATGYRIEYTSHETGFNGNADIAFEYIAGPKVQSSSLVATIPNTVYHIRVVAVGIGAYRDSESSESLTALTLPDVAANLHISQNETNVKITWDAPVNGAESYKVEYSFDTTTWILIENINSTSYTHNKIEPNTTYHYRVTSVNAAGTSDGVECYIVTLPDVPSNLRLKQNAQNIQIMWDAPRNGADSYKLEHSLDKTNWTLVDDVIGTSYNHTQSEFNTTYYYRISSVNESGTSTFIENEITTLPDVPKDLSLTQVNHNIEITWNAPTNGTDSYRLEYSLDGKNWTILDNVIDTGYVHIQIEENTAYYYRISSVNDAGNSKTVQNNIQTLPGEPTNLQVVENEDNLHISWNAPVKGADAYQLEYSLNGENWVVLGGTLGDTYYVHNAVEPNTVYHYRVSSVNTAGHSEFSNVMQIRTTIPIELDADDIKVYETSRNGDEITFHLKDVVNSTYGIQKIVINYTDDNGIVKELFLDNANNWTTLAVELTPNSTYTFNLSVIAIDNTFRVPSPFSLSTASEAFAMQLSDIESNGMFVAWNPIFGISNYIVEYSRTPDFLPGNDIHGKNVTDRVHVSGTSVDLRGLLLVNTDYYIRMLAVIDGVEVVLSDVVQETTSQGKLTSPANVQVEPGEGVSLNISWNSVANASAYQVTYTTTNGDIVSNSVLVEGKTSLVLAALTAETEYQISVIAIGNKDYIDSEPSAITEKTIITTGIVIANVANAARPSVQVHAKAATLSSVTMTLSTPANNRAVAYNINVYNRFGVDITDSVSIAFSTDTQGRTVAVIGNLPSSGERYRITVQSVNANGQESAIRAVNATTLKAQNANLKPKVVRAVKNTTDTGPTISTVQLSWATPQVSSKIGAYTITIRGQAPNPSNPSKMMTQELATMTIDSSGIITSIVMLPIIINDKDVNPLSHEGLSNTTFVDMKDRFGNVVGTAIEIHGLAQGTRYTFETRTFDKSENMIGQVSRINAATVRYNAVKAVIDTKVTTTRLILTPPKNTPAGAEYGNYIVEVYARGMQQIPENNLVGADAVLVNGGTDGKITDNFVLLTGNIHPGEKYTVIIKAVTVNAVTGHITESAPSRVNLTVVR